MLAGVTSLNLHCQPNAGTGEIDGRSVHVDGGSKRNHKAGDRLGDTSRGFGALKCHRHGGSTGSASERLEIGS